MFMNGGWRLGSAIAVIVIGVGLIAFWGLRVQAERSVSAAEATRPTAPRAAAVSRLDQCLKRDMQVLEGDRQAICQSIAQVIAEAEQLRGMSVEVHLRQEFETCVADMKEEGKDDPEDRCTREDGLWRYYFEATMLALCDFKAAVVLFPDSGESVVRRGRDVYEGGDTVVYCGQPGEAVPIEEGFIPLLQVDEDALYPDPAKEITDAIDNDDFAAFRKLLAQKPDWSGFPYAQNWVVGDAAASGNPAFLKALLDQGWPVNIDVQYYRQPLGRAIRSGTEASALLLVEHGARLQVPGEFGQQPLPAAAERGFNKLAERLLAQGVDPNSQKAEDLVSNHYKPIESAAERGDEALVTLLFKHGASVSDAEAFNRHGENPHGYPINAAAKGGKLKIVQAFLDHDAKVLPANAELVVDAIHGANPEVLQLLFQKGLTLPAKPESHEEIRDQLSRRVSEQARSFDASSKPGEYPLIDGAAFLGGLLEHGLLLDMADEGLYLKQVLINVSPGCDWREKLKNIRHSQQVFVHAVADATIKSGIDINRADSEGMTALMAAAQEGQDEIVKLLLDRGADPALRDKEGQTAADIVGVKARWVINNTVTCPAPQLKDMYRRSLRLLGVKE